MDNKAQEHAPDERPRRVVHQYPVRISGAAMSQGGSYRIGPRGSATKMPYRAWQALQRLCARKTQRVGGDGQAQLVGGKGGGRPDMAQAGGTDAAALPAALAGVAEWVGGKLG